MSRLSARQRMLLRILLASVSLIASLEVTLQIASRLLPDYARGAAAPGDRFLILAMGDSHTYGVIEPPELSYPAQLQTRLEASEPGRFGVLNLGIPGSSTYELRQRLPRAIEQYDPDLVLVWAGVNNEWNVEGRDELQSEGVESWLGWSRLYRLYKVARADPGHGLESGAEIRSDGTPQPVRKVEGRDNQDLTWRVDQGLGEETIESRRAEQNLSFEEAEAIGYADYSEIVRIARDAAVPVIFLQYPLEVGGFGAANQAIARVGEESGALVFATRPAVRRVPRKLAKWLWGAHPNRHM